MSRDFDERDHPRHPGGAPDGRGGEFREKTNGGGWAERVAGRFRQAFNPTHDRPMTGDGPWQAMTRFELHQMVQSGAEPVGQVSGGEMAHTQLMAHPGGRVSIHKTYPEIFADRVHNEVAVGLVAEAIGAPYPAVIEDPQDRLAIFMQYVESKKTDIGLPRRSEFNRDLQTDDGLLLGFLDILTINGDRNGGNYLHTPDERMVGIDGGEAFLGVQREDKDGSILPPTLRVPAFSTRFTRLSPWLGRPEWKDNDLSPEDFDAARPRLQALERHFRQMEMGEAHRLMMERFEAMAAHATGTERKLPI